MYDELRCVVASSSANMIALTETWLKNDINDADIYVGASDYYLYVLDSGSCRFLLFMKNLCQFAFFLNVALEKIECH